MANIQSVKDADVAGKRVIVRADLNVPLQNGAVVNDLRIRAIVPTLELLHQKGAAQITLLAHLGRPQGVVVETLRLAPVEAALRTLTSVPFVMHENLRFDPREEQNDPTLAQELSELGDVFVNEAFADSHRRHASIVGVPALLPSFAGLRLEEEMQRLSAALTPPQGSIALVGGVKFETKAPFIKKLLALYGEVLLGGALANDVIKARGLPFGESLVSAVPVEVEVATNDRLVIATDAVVLEEDANAERVTSVVDIRKNERVVDIGPRTASIWGTKVAAAPFVLWNGPLGIYEQGFTDGTDAIAQALTKSGVRGVVGGGDTAAAIEKHQLSGEHIFVSTGGGAMLHFLTEGTLPGIEALKS